MTTTMTMSTTTMTKNNDEDDDNKYNDDETMTTTMMATMTNRMIAVQIGEGKLLRNIMWHGCYDPTHYRIRDCVRATQYRGRTIEHAT